MPNTNVLTTFQVLESRKLINGFSQVPIYLVIISSLLLRFAAQNRDLGIWFKSVLQTTQIKFKMGILGA